MTVVVVEIVCVVQVGTAKVATALVVSYVWL